METEKKKLVWVPLDIERVQIVKEGHSVRGSKKILVKHPTLDSGPRWFGLSTKGDFVHVREDGIGLIIRKKDFEESEIQK